MNIEQLNNAFAIANQLNFVNGPGDLPLIEINNDHASALISVYAGQVLAYQPLDASADMMFLSEKAYYQAGKAIKGGVPICWPWFGPDPENKGRPAHGFVRNRMWSVIETAADDDGATRVILQLHATDETLQLWPHSFELQLEVTVGSSLGLKLTTRNTGSTAFTISQALHTYFRVGDIQQTAVHGLENCSYLDKAANGETKSQQGAIIVEGEVDRIYLDVPSQLSIVDNTLARRLVIHSTGNKTAVVWNPWSKIAAEMADLEDDDFLRMLCVETTNAADDIITVAPASEFSLTVDYQIQAIS